MYSSSVIFSYESIYLANKRIESYIHHTPVHSSCTLNALCPGKELFFKCENLQKTGSFKSRGAMNAVLCALERNSQLQGVVTHSSGNHGQALAWAAAQKGLKCVVVVPEKTPLAKLSAISAYGAEVVKCEATMTARWSTCEKISRERSYSIVDPHNDWDVMAGQGTVALELIEQVPELDAIIVSIGGGGLAAGVSVFAKEGISHPIKVFCAEVEGKCFQRQLESGQREESGEMLCTVADGIRVKQIGSKCFTPLLKCAEKTVFSMTEAEIRSATFLIWQRLKMVVEPSAALPLAAVRREHSSKSLRNCSRIGLVLCGGNMNLEEIIR